MKSILPVYVRTYIPYAHCNYCSRYKMLVYYLYVTQCHLSQRRNSSSALLTYPMAACTIPMQSTGKPGQSIIKDRVHAVQKELIYDNHCRFCGVKISNPWIGDFPAEQRTKGGLNIPIWRTARSLVPAVSRWSRFITRQKKSSCKKGKKNVFYPSKIKSKVSE